MSGYRHEQGEWIDGLGTRHIVVRFYVPGEDDDWLTCTFNLDGTVQRLWSRGPVHMRSGARYASVDEAAAAVEAAHRDWLASDREGWRRAIGVLKAGGVTHEGLHRPVL